MDYETISQREKRAVLENAVLTKFRLHSPLCALHLAQISHKL